MLADIVLAVLFVLVLFNGYKKGFVKTLLRFAGLFLFLILFVITYKPVGEAFGGGTAGVLAAMVVSIVISSAAELILCKIAKLPGIKQMNKLLGGIMGAVNGIVIVVALSFILASIDKFAPYTKDSYIISEVISFFS